jgi:hypothetical protein
MTKQSTHAEDVQRLRAETERCFALYRTATGILQAYLLALPDEPSEEQFQELSKKQETASVFLSQYERVKMRCIETMYSRQISR